MADHSYNHLSVHPNSSSNSNSNQNQNLQQVATNSNIGEQQTSANSNKSLVRGNSVATLNQIYQHHNSIPVRNRILNTAKSLYSSVEVPAFASGGPDSLPDDTILLPAGGTSAQRYALSPEDCTTARLSYVAGQQKQQQLHQQQQKSVQSSQLLPSSSSAFQHQQRLQQQQLRQNQQQPHQNPRNVQATSPSKYPTHSLATSPVRVINVARRHKKQASGSIANQHETYQVTGGTSNYSLVGSSQSGVQGAQAWHQNSQQQSVMSSSPRRSKLAAWSSDSSSCSSSRDASPIRGTSPTQQRSPTNSARQLEIQHQHQQQQQQQQQQQIGLPRSTSPSPTTSRNKPIAPAPSDTSPNQSLKQNHQHQQQHQQKSPSPRRRVLPKIGTTNQAQSFALDNSPVRQRHSYLESSSATVMTGRSVETAMQQAAQQQQQHSVNTSTKRHRKLPQIPTRASVQQLNISSEQLQLSSGSNQLQSETAIQSSGSGVGGCGSYAPGIPARKMAPNKSLSSSSSASSNSPTVGDTRNGSGVVLQQTIVRQQTLGLNHSSTGGIQAGSVRNQNLSSGEQLRVLSYPMPNESQTVSNNSANVGANLVCPLARANTLVHPPSLGHQSRSALSSSEQYSAYGEPQQQTSQLMNQTMGPNSERNKSLDCTSPPGQMNRVTSYKQSPLMSRQKHSTSSSSSSNSPAAVTGNNRSPSYSQQQQHQMSRYFTFESAQALSTEQAAPSLMTTAPSVQSSPFTNYKSSENPASRIISDETTATAAALVVDQNDPQLDHQLNVSNGNQNELANSAGRGRRLSTCGSGLRANFLMNKQHAISEFTPPRSLESSTSRGSTDANAGSGAGLAVGASQMMPCTTSADGSLAPHSYSQLVPSAMFASDELMGVGVANNNSNSNSNTTTTNKNNNLDWTSTANTNLNLANTNDNNNNNNCEILNSSFNFVGVPGNRSLSTQNITSCGSLTNQATNFILPKSPMISPGNSPLVGQSPHQIAHSGPGMSLSNCDLQLNLHQQQLVNNISLNEQRNNNGLLSPRITNNNNLNTSSACPIMSIGNYTTVANYMQRRPSAALAGLPPRAASATEASSLHPHDVLNTATSSTLAPTNFTEGSNFHRTLSANVKLAPAARSMIMQTSSANYVTSSDVAFSGAGAGSSTFCNTVSGDDKPISSATANVVGKTTLTNPSPSLATAATTTPTMSGNLSRERRLLPPLAATNALSVDVYHNGNEDSYIPSVMSSASVTATNLSPSFVGNKVRQQAVNSQQNEQQQQQQQQQWYYSGQYEQRNSLALPSPRDRQHSNVSTNSMPAGALIGSSSSQVGYNSQKQASCSVSPGHHSASQAAAAAGGGGEGGEGRAAAAAAAASLSQANSGEAQKARKFGAWADRIAASNNAASGTIKGMSCSKQGLGAVGSSSSSTSRRARSTSQLDGPSSGNGHRSGIRRSISESSTTTSSGASISGDSRVSSGDDDDGYDDNNRRSGYLVGESGESEEETSSEDDASSIDSTQLSHQRHKCHDKRQDYNDSSSSSHSISNSVGDNSKSTSNNNNSNRGNQNEFGQKKKTILARRHKHKKLASSVSRSKSNKREPEATLTAIIAGGKSVDQLTLSDRLKLAESAANELFRKVELSPQSQLSGTTKQGSLDSSSTTAPNQAAQNAFFSANTLMGPANSGYQSRVRSQGNSTEDQQFHLKNNNNNNGSNSNNNFDNKQTTLINFSAPKGGGESYEFADDEQGDDLSLFLRSVDKQRLKQQRKQQQQQQLHQDSSDQNKFLPPSNKPGTLCRDNENASINNSDNNNNTFSSNPSTRLNKQTSKLLLNVRGSLRLGKLRQNNSISGFHNTSLRQQQSLAVKDEIMMHHHQQQQTTMGNNNAQPTGNQNIDAEAVKIRIRPPKVVRRAITLRSLAKTFSWRANSCEYDRQRHQQQEQQQQQQQQQILTNKNRASSGQIGSPNSDAACDNPESAGSNLHARLLASSAAPLTDPAPEPASTTIGGISGDAASRSKHATDHSSQMTPPSKEPQQQTRSSGGQWLLQSAPTNPFSSFQRPSLSSFSQRFSTSSQRGEEKGATYSGVGGITKRGSHSRNSSSCSNEAEELAQSATSKLSVGKIAREGSTGCYYGIPAEFLPEQRRGTTSTSTLTKHHHSLGRMKSVITTVSRRLETLRLMKGKQAHSDDCSATANYDDKPGEIRYDVHNIQNHTNVENNNASNSKNNNFDHYFR